MRRFGVIVFSLLLLLAALAPSSLSDDRLAFALVGIEAQIGGDPVRSAGVVIDAGDGLVLTTAHSLWGATTLRLSTGVGVLHGRIVARAPCADLALVETQPRIPGLVALTGTATPTGNVTAARPADGAPLLDGADHIVGIRSRGTMTRWPAVKRLLDRLKPDKQRVYRGWAYQYRCTPRLHAYEKARHPRYRAIDARLTAPVPATRLPGTGDLDR